MIARALLVLLALVTAAALALGQAVARAHGEPEVTARPASAAPGDMVTVDGEGFEGGSTVVLTMVGGSGESDLGTVTADDEGTFRFEAMIDQTMAPGSVEIHAQSGEAHAVTRLTVAGADAETTIGTVATQLTVTGEQEEDGHMLLSATLTDAQGEPVPAALVAFFVQAELLGVTGKVAMTEAETDVNGLAEAEYTPTFGGTVRATARFEGIGFYKPSEGGADVEIAQFQPAYTLPGKGLESLRRWAPVGLALVVAGVWFVFGFVGYQVYRIARAGGAA